MSGLAEVLLNLGYAVTGSDVRRSEATERLSQLGGRIFYSHDGRQVESAQVVVFSSAISDDNPELVAARRLGLPVIPRAELLSELMRMKFGVAVAGAHGKTTTTTLVGSVLARGGLDPTVVVGGRVHSFGSGVHLGQGQFLVAEADESDGSFLRLTPVISVITNIDFEHVDHYKDLDEIRSVFAEFIRRIPFYGLIVGCADDPEVSRLLAEPHERRTLSYGLHSGDVQARNLELAATGSRFEVWYREHLIGEIETRVVGQHMVLNALAAVCVGCELEIPFSLIRQGLAESAGVGRRFEIKGETHSVMVIDDYGHHPTEIRATLAAAKTLGRRLVVVFQPHRYSRTQALADGFGKCFDDADYVIVTDIYSAGEKPIEGVTAELIVGAARSHGHREVKYAGDLARAKALLKEVARPQDVVLTLGAGDVWKVGEEFLADRENNAPEPTGERS
jgi:UDP-N-acetylmuramate--alanine ligase